MTSDSRQEEGKRFFMRSPPDWDEMSEERKLVAARLMAHEARRQRGLVDEE